MIVYLVRHAKAEASHPEGDHARRLSEKGIGRLNTLVQPLRERGVRPQRHFTSPLVRARQTARILAEGLGWRGEPESLDLILPSSQASDFPPFLRELGDVSSAAFYTHNPFVQELADYLLDPATVTEDIVFHTPSVLALEISPPYRPGSGKFLWILHHRGD